MANSIQVPSLVHASYSSFFFSSRRRHTRCLSDWSSDVCSSDLLRSLREELQDLERALLQLHESRFDLVAGGLELFDAPDARHHERVALEILDQIGRASCRERV